MVEYETFGDSAADAITVTGDLQRVLGEQAGGEVPVHLETRLG